MYLSVTSLFTENCTEETRKSKKGRRSELMYTTVSSLRSSTEESVESNRIDFPKQIRIKRKYLLVVRRKSSEEGHTADA